MEFLKHQFFVRHFFSFFTNREKVTMSRSQGPCSMGSECTDVEFVLQLEKKRTRNTPGCCPKCLGRRSSSGKCKFYKKKANIDRYSVQPDKTEKKIITDSTSATETNKQLNRLIELSDSNNELKGAKVDDSDISKPTFTYVGKMESEAEAKKRYKPVVNADAKNSSPLLLCLRFTKRIIIIKRLSL